jgi:hypothetical protein
MTTGEKPVAAARSPPPGLWSCACSKSEERKREYTISTQARPVFTTGLAVPDGYIAPVRIRRDAQTLSG